MLLLGEVNVLTLEELLTEIKRRPTRERLTLLEELVHSLREDLGDQPTISPIQSTPEDLGWPPGYFEQTYGSLRDEPLERGPQGVFETREELQ